MDQRVKNRPSSELNLRGIYISFFHCLTGLCRWIRQHRNAILVNVIAGIFVVIFVCIGQWVFRTAFSTGTQDQTHSSYDKPSLAETKVSSSKTSTAPDEVRRPRTKIQEVKKTTSAEATEPQIHPTVRTGAGWTGFRYSYNSLLRTYVPTTPKYGFSLGTGKLVSFETSDFSIRGDAISKKRFFHAPNPQTWFADLGPVPLVSVNAAPKLIVGYGKQDYRLYDVSVIIGHTYCVALPSGHYAKLRITDVKKLLHPWDMYYSFEYALQTEDGVRDFHGH